ncbi:unnamed protein product [Rangifer tarandus platyrhynchus]|uniref:Uncharacterized protein n=2 Tax=Rangifer tarandus platyrhynchus TaxID=3082113 RepID=A0ACB0DVW5_RANTA|nr:unnamed protein product [Rangifer tarandus platyrhynchus]CAI9692306.1 unnamed protein product [Rangifer tarandus platyrhynchus]
MRAGQAKWNCPARPAKRLGVPRAADGAGSGRRLLWVVVNHSQPVSWSRRGEEEEESERVAGDEKESEGRCGEAEDRRGRKDHADAERPLGSQPCAGLGGSGARGAAGGARVRPGAWQMRESPPRPSRSSSGCLGRRRGPQSTRAAGPPGPSPAPRASRPRLPTARGAKRRHCGSDAR